MVSLCPEGEGASVSRPCSDGIDVLVIQQAKPLPQELQAYCFQLDKFHVGKDGARLLGVLGCCQRLCLPLSPSAPQRVLPQQACSLEGFTVEWLLNWHFLHTPQASLIYSLTLLLRGPFYLSRVRMEQRDAPPGVFTIREGVRS